MQTVRVLPPRTLMAEIEEPCMKGNTNFDLAAYAMELAGALKRANASMKALREWADAADE